MQRGKGTEVQRGKGAKGQRHSVTEAQSCKGTEVQRHKATKESIRSHVIARRVKTDEAISWNLKLEIATPFGFAMTSGGLF